MTGLQTFFPVTSGDARDRTTIEPIEMQISLDGHPLYYSDLMKTWHFLKRSTYHDFVLPFDWTARSVTSASRECISSDKNTITLLLKSPISLNSTEITCQFVYWTQEITKLTNQKQNTPNANPHAIHSCTCISTDNEHPVTM